MSGPEVDSLSAIANLKTIRIIRLFKLVRLLRVEALLEHLEFSLPMLSAVGFPSLPPADFPHPKHRLAFHLMSIQFSHIL